MVPEEELNCDCKASAKQHSAERIAADPFHRLDKGSVIFEGLHRAADMIKSEKDPSRADHGQAPVFPTIAGTKEMHKQPD
jgi:hypothetical protein